MLVVYQNGIHDEIRSILNVENACCCSAQNGLSFSLLSRNLEIKVCKTIIWMLFCMGPEIWLLALTLSLPSLAIELRARNTIAAWV
jgi:hypothetical protein